MVLCLKTRESRSLPGLQSACKSLITIQSDSLAAQGTATNTGRGPLSFQGKYFRGVEQPARPQIGPPDRFVDGLASSGYA